MAKDEKNADAAPAKSGKQQKGAGKSGAGKGGAGKSGAGKGPGKGGKKKAEATGPAPTYTREKPPRLRSLYDGDVKAAMMKEFGYKSVMQVPRVVKVTLNMGLGRANQDAKVIENAVDEMKAICGQAPVVCRAKRDIATFKLRRGQKIGVMVTLRRERMWEFMDRLCGIALPRVRDFRGVSPKGFDGRGNFTLGIREQIIFPEIEYDRIDSIKGLNISIVTTAKTDAEGRALLQHLGVPFRQSTPAGAAQ
jgi:large subunit ribosomal protein L5